MNTKGCVIDMIKAITDQTDILDEAVPNAYYLRKSIQSVLGNMQ